MFRITKIDGKLTSESRQVLKDWHDNLQDGTHEIDSKRITRTYLTRYKYYFGYLLPEIIKACNLVEIDRSTGETWPMKTETLHDFLKKHHNSVFATNPFTGELIKVASSTTNLTDGEFIDRYESEIAAHFQTHFQVDLWSRSEWIAKKKVEYQ